MGFSQSFDKRGPPLSGDDIDGPEPELLRVSKTDRCDVSSRHLPPEDCMILFGCLCFCLVLALLAFSRQLGSALEGLRLRLFGVPVRVPARPAQLLPDRPVASVPWRGSIPPVRFKRAGP